MSSSVSAQRRRLLGGLSVLALGLGSGAAINRLTPPNGYHAATGVRKTVSLADGNRLVLNARSAADVHFNNVRRLVRLYESEFLVQVVADPLRPFEVITVSFSLMTEKPSP